jgi:hypothetical protein
VWVVRVLVLLVVVCGVVLGGGGVAWGASGWWHVGLGSRPSSLVVGGLGELVVVVENVGDGGVEGGVVPVRVGDVLPVGLRAVAVAGGVPFGNVFSPIHGCGISSPVSVFCEFEGVLAPFGVIEVRVLVEVVSAPGVGEVERASVTGGEVGPVSVQAPVRASGGGGFGVESFSLDIEEDGGAGDVQAGSHPFQMTTSLALNQGADSVPVSELTKPEVEPVALPKDVITGLPVGLLGDPTSVPACSLGRFLKNENGEDQCPAQTAVGVASVTANIKSGLKMSTFTVPLFNLERGFGEPARLGFFIPEGNLPVVLDPVIRSGPGGDYGVDIDARNLSQAGGVLSARITVWGVPGDPRHDHQRGWNCIYLSNGFSAPGPCNALEESDPSAFLRLPTSCSGPIQSTGRIDSWDQPGEFLAFAPDEPLQALGGCNRLGFAPTIKAAPDTTSGSAGAGFDFGVDVSDEGLTGGESLGQSDVKGLAVTLPEGVTINPSAANGLGVCSQAAYEAETLERQSCPLSSRIAEVSVQTPLLDKVLHGFAYVAAPFANPFGTLLAGYVVIKDPETGVLVKVPEKITADHLTGRLAAFAEVPQLPFSHLSVHFREGPQAALITPPGCGLYPTTAVLTPWSDPMASIPTEAPPFVINSCPVAGFAPHVTAGYVSNSAGSFSPFTLRLTRTDSEPELASLGTTLPAGLTADLTGVPYCPEAAIAAARKQTGVGELQSPSCPKASQLGETLAGAGVGETLSYIPGSLYLAGPYRGAPFSLVAITPAVVGPFDIGNVVLRFALRIDPNTTTVTVEPTPGEPIPRILEGIVAHTREIRVMIDRPNFTLNPTNCNPTQITTTLGSTQGQTSIVQSRFQAANCKALKFAPKLKASTQGHTSRVNGASLTVKLVLPKTPLGTQSNIAAVKVELPRALPARLETLNKACTAAQFNTNPAGCPPDSIVGHARATTPILPTPLEGPAYFVSHGNEAFPNLILVLQGDGVTLNLTSITHIKHGITSSTFATIPDQPVNTFEITLPEQRHSALGTANNLCTTKLTMPTTFTAQNGTQQHQHTTITPTNCPKPKKHTTKHKTKTKKH